MGLISFGIAGRQLRLSNSDRAGFLSTSMLNMAT